MASSRGTLNGPDWKDVVGAAQAFAQDWSGVVTLSLRPAGTLKNPILTIVAQLWADQRSVGVVRPLASASVSMPGSGVGDIHAAALSALYELDKEIYRREIGVSPIGR